MGGQDCKAIKCDVEGKVTNFIMNDKCAGGTGRFLEMIADVLNVPLEEIGNLSLESKTAIPFNTICAVFAKSDAIANLRKGVAKSDILAGLHEAIATRSLSLLKRVSIEKDFTITGGIAKNRGMVAKLREKAGLEPLLCEDPQIIGALGAALFAEERLSKGTGAEKMMVHYGYSDGTGEYFIAIDASLCDGCGECVLSCPSAIFSLEKLDSAEPKAVVKEEARKKIALLCPGLDYCTHKVNCHSVCQKNAISHSW
jgi:ferredoxin